MVKLYFSRTREVMWTIFDIYDYLMTVYSINSFYDQWPFCYVAIATFKEKIFFLNDNSFKTTEAVWL